MSIYYADGSVTLHAGDCLDVLRELPDASVDAVVTDPPYGLGFMGKEWDNAAALYRPPSAAAGDSPLARFRTGKGPAAVAFDGVAFQAWCIEWTAECLRVLKPGGHLLAFGGTRTWHRLACAVEDAGFEIRDSIAWLYGSGFPKSLDVSKAIDKAAGAEREVIGVNPLAAKQTAKADVTSLGAFAGTSPDITAPATPEAARWQGFGTALKPSHEPVVVARKPLQGTVAANVLAHGTGALNVDGCRVGDEVITQHGRGDSQSDSMSGRNYAEPAGRTWSGRWPANVVLDEASARALDEMSGELPTQVTRTDPARRSGGGMFGLTDGGERSNPGAGETGGASRFFYVAKADASERVRVNGTAHPTVKPLALMRWLVRLVTPPGGTVLEPFAGSGTTVEACLLEGFRCIAIEREADYLPLIVQRINRRRDPVAAVKATGDDGGLFDLLDGGAA